MAKHLLWTTAPGDPDALIDAGPDPSPEHVRALLAEGPVLVPLTGAGTGPLAAASVYAWLGVSAFTTSGDPEELRQVLDMVAAIRGSRPPAVGRRALA